MNRSARNRVVAAVLVGVLVLSLVGSLLTVGTAEDPATEVQVTDSAQTLVPGPSVPDATTGTGEPVAPAGDETDPVEEADETAPERFSDLRPITVDELPGEAVDTILLIDAGGPFPYDRDGITFFNREGLLPPAAEGFYREYTVPTPGLDHRGARRLVVGANGAVYYTDDHYESFSEVVG